MEDILVKGASFVSYDLGWVYRDYGEKDVATREEGIRVFKDLRDFLDREGKIVYPEVINPSPHEGMFSDPSISSAYVFRNTFVSNTFKPYFDNNKHTLQIAGRVDDTKVIQDNLSLLLSLTEIKLRKYWKLLAERKIKLEVLL